MLILTGLSILLTWPLLPHMQNTLISWGDPVFQTWTLSWNWHALTTSPLNIFDANIFYPWRNTLAYSDHLFGQTLMVLPILALTGNGILANNVAVFLALILSGMAMYLLVYDITGNRVAAILAGVAYAFAPARMAHLEHLHLLSGQWPPLALLCLRRTTLTTGRVRWRWAAGLGAVFIAQGLSGIYFFYYTVVMLIVAGTVYLGFALLDRDRETAKAIGASAAACAVAGLILLPALLPYLQVRDDLGIERGHSEVNFWSAEMGDLVAVSPANRLYNGPLSEFHRDLERDLFPGVMLTGLAVIGLFHRRHRRIRWVFLAVTLSSVVLAFGLTGKFLGIEYPLPYQLFYDWMPGFRAIRVPARFGLLALVGMAGLAGLGLDLLWRWLRSRLQDDLKLPVAAGALIIGLAILWAEAATIVALPGPLPIETPRDRADYEYVASQSKPILELPMGDGPVASAWPNYWSTLHWSPVANGYSGIVPPSYDLLREQSKNFPDPEFVDILQGSGIETVLIHDTPGLAGQNDVNTSATAHPAVTRVLTGKDSVYTIDPDPWMWDFADAVPGGETIDMPHADANPLAYGFMMAIFQRTGHAVSGNGTIGYYELSAPSSPRCYLVLNANDDPASYGYPDTVILDRSAGFILYRNTNC